MKKQPWKPLLEVLTPIGIIMFFMVIALVAVVGMGLVSPAFASEKWTWLVYLVGGLLIFLLYRARARKGRSSHQTLDGHGEIGSVHAPEGSAQNLESIRKRIRDRKAREQDPPEG
ncbi:MAG: hypothetical protein HY913_11105 [Desulfomonile tiedjei]|nr:hypothetical protein [Desulfomonile tiedjei]